MGGGRADTQEQAIGRHCGRQLPLFVVTTPTVAKAALGGSDSAPPAVVARNGGLLQRFLQDLCGDSLA
jgi:hypothetical protein